MKKLFKFIGILVLLLVIALGIYYFVNHEPLPKGEKGKEADALAIRMLNALNNDAFLQSETLEWSFRGKHFYKWHKQENIVEVSWDKNKVILHTSKPSESKIFIDNEKVNKVPLFDKRIKTTTIRSIVFDKDDKALIALEGLGLLTMNENFKVVNKIKYNPNSLNSLSQESIYKIFVFSYNLYIVF